MIAVQVAHQHRRDGVGVDAPFADRHHRGGAAIDQQIAVLAALEVKAGVEPPTAAEGVTGTEELQAHGATKPVSVAQGACSKLDTSLVSVVRRMSRTWVWS